MAEIIDFTVPIIEALAAPASGRLEYKDSQTAGLYLRVTKRGVKTFSFVGRAKGSSRVERNTIGKFPTVKPAQARNTAKQLAGKLAGGKSVASAARELRGEMIVDELSESYLEYLRVHARKPEDFESRYRLYIAPHFGRRRLSEIKPGNVSRWLRNLPGEILKRRATKDADRRAMKAQHRREVLERHAKLGRRYGPDPKQDRTHLSAGRVNGKTTANRAYDALRAMFNWSMSADGENVFAGPNPAIGQRKFPKIERDRFLQADEIGAFFEAVALETNLEARDCLLIQLLSGGRRSNCHEMRWSEVNLVRAEWRVAMTKNGDPQTVVLVPEAVAILEERKKTAGSSPWVFPSEKSKTGHIVNTAKVWRRILERAKLADLREHDLRRSLGSWQAREGASLVMIGKSLNHRDPGSTKVYARLDIDPVRQSMVRATSSMLQAAGMMPAAEIIQFPKPAAKAARKSARK